MVSKRALELSLSELEGLSAPSAELEQYPTPPRVAATMVHLADLNGDLDNVVVDLGAGTGIIALGAALREPPRVVGIELDRDAILTAEANEREVAPPLAIDWIQADATGLPVCIEGATVLMNPPFGAQYTNRHADKEFLTAAASIAAVSYSLHNVGSRAFIESFVQDHAGAITHAFETEFTLDRQFDFHKLDTWEGRVELYRIDWT